MTMAMGPPPEGMTHWSVREVAKRTGMSPATVHRLFRERGLQPHRTETFKFSTDPALEAKVRDVVGLYLDPPDGAIVLQRRREDPDPGARSHPADAADAPGPGRAPYP